MAAFAGKHEELRAAGAGVIAASVDPLDKAQEVAAQVPYAVAYGVTRTQADAIGAWWEDRRGIVQPSEFIVGPNGAVIDSSYSSGPIGRIDPADVLKRIAFVEKQAAK